MVGDLETIEIRDESDEDGPKHTLYIDGCRRAYVDRRRGYVGLHWEVYGRQQWPEARALIAGLLELSIVADQLTGEEDVKAKRKK